MALRLFLLFTLGPLVELALLIWIGEHTSIGFTVGLVLLTGAAGAWLARRQGLRCWHDIRSQMARGQIPADPLCDAVLILVAGVLLIAPGVLTDLAGILLLLPPVRQRVRPWLMRRLTFRVRGWAGHPGNASSPPDRDRIIDVQVVDAHPADNRPQDASGGSALPR